jgi:hypothetical protein
VTLWKCWDYVASFPEFNGITASKCSLINEDFMNLSELLFWVIDCS